MVKIRVEPFDINNATHAALDTINNNYGAGEIQYVIWTAGHHGYVLCKLQYGDAMPQFNIGQTKEVNGSLFVQFRGRRKVVKD